ncbi:hypothetical protein CLM69_24680, partial [Serratia marcescens]
KIGLVSIRNMLAHGDYFPDELLNPLFVAGECLKLILQEIIFKVIGWELSKKNNVAEAKPNVKFYPEYINECIGMMTNHITKRN